ncbi:MAG: hypothetical protein GY769_00965 [bacterium]|nr:hypothetical protein [bacterium]
MVVSSLVLAMVIALAAGCGGATPVSPEPIPAAVEQSSDSPGEGTAAEITLRYDETVEFQELELRWLELEDSRCPIGVKCIWAGQMVVTVEAARGDDKPLEVELLRRVGREPETAEALGYELRLLEVDPHPKEGVTPERGDYVARIEITGP